MTIDLNPKFWRMDDNELSAWVTKYNPIAGALEECGELFDDIEWFDDEEDTDEDRQEKRDNLESIAEQILDTLKAHQ
jgi:hypothetical protein